MRKKAKRLPQETWWVAGVDTHRLPPFVTNLHLLFPEDAVLFLDCMIKPTDPMVEFLRARIPEITYEMPTDGSGSPGYEPDPNLEWHMAMSKENVANLAVLASKTGDLEVSVMHMHVYRGQIILMEGWDRGDGGFLVAKSVPEEKIKAFCTSVGSTYRTKPDRGNG